MNEPMRQAKPGNARAYAALGIVQGVMLWLLYVAGRDKFWPATSPGWFGGLVHFVLATPLAWFLTEGIAVGRLRRAAVAAGIGALLVLLGAHAFSDGAAGTSGIGAWLAAAVATLVLSHVLVSLTMGYQPGERRLHYTRLFEFAWRNALLVPTASLRPGRQPSCCFGLPRSPCCS